MLSSTHIRRSLAGAVTVLAASALFVAPAVAVSTGALRATSVHGATYKGEGAQYFNNHKCLNGAGLNCYGIAPGTQKFSFRVTPSGKDVTNFNAAFSCACACTENNLPIPAKIPIKHGAFSTTFRTSGGNFTYVLALIGHFVGNGKSAGVTYVVSGMPPAPCAARVVGVAHAK